MSAPDQAIVDATRASSQRHTLRAYLVIMTGVSPESVEVPISGGTVTLDEAWMPHAQATLDLSAMDPDLLPHLDPRTGNRVRLRMGLYAAGVDEGQDLPVLQITDLSVRRTPTGRTVTVHAASLDVQFLTSYVNLAVYPTTQVRTAVKNMIEGVGWNIGTVTQAATSTVGVPVTETPFWLPRTDPVSNWIIEWGQGAGLRVVPDDELAGFTIRDTVTTYAAEPAAWFTEGVNLTEYALEQSDAPNAAHLRWSNDLAGWAVLDVDEPQRYQWWSMTGDGPATVWRTAMAEKYARRAYSRGGGITLTAPSMFWLRPTDTVGYVLDDLVSGETIATRVRYDLTGHTVEVTGREPSDVPVVAG